MTELFNGNDVVVASNVAEKLIEVNTSDYAKYIIKNQFPAHIDGLKKVHRRIIWMLRDQQKRFSGLHLIGRTSTIHPYNDISIYDCAVKMSQPFQTVFPLLNLFGENGSYSGDTAAAGKYTEFSLSEFCKDVFLRGVEMQTLSFELTELLIGYEPSYFIPKVPTGLISFSETIGFGFKSVTFSYPMEAVCDLVESYANHLDKYKDEGIVRWDYSKLLDNFIPYFPIKNVIRNKKKLLNSYKNSNFNSPIMIDGVIKIIDENTVLIVTIPYRNSIINLKKTLIGIMKNKKSEFGKNIDYKPASCTEKEADLLIKFKRNTNFFDMVERLKEVIKFRSEFSPFNNFAHNDKIIEKSPILVLKEWYKERYYSILGKKKHQQTKLINRKRQLEALIIVGNNVKDIINIIHNETEDECLKTLMEKYDLTFYQSKYIRGSKISVLAKTDFEKVKEEYESIKLEVNILLESFNKIHQEIIDDINFFRKNYPTPDDGSYIPEYIGYLIVKNKGMVMLESFIELSKLINIFKNEDKKVFLFPKKIKDAIIVNNFGNHIRWDIDILFEKISNKIDIIFNTDDMHESIILKDGNTFRLKGIHRLSDSDQVFYTNSSNFKALQTNGSILNISSDLIPLRSNTSNQGNKTNNLYYWDDNNWGNEKYLLFTHSSVVNTKIMVDIIDKKTKKIITYVDGKTTVLGLFPITDENIILNLNNGYICLIKPNELDLKKREFLYSKYKI